ncbi:7004_t:CDS:2 [Paraglomus brasilianum]|uniref:7004_t:CDS:1 n=1 Tax=Paraglomus brasilianum TaxID=144538 RepID=A0A9N8VRD7_9GLOM|nr:7004_t:CDS:2 [Paraglomus brasilianum]
MSIRTRSPDYSVTVPFLQIQPFSPDSTMLSPRDFARLTYISIVIQLPTDKNTNASSSFKYKMILDEYDYSQAKFDWRIDPRGYLIPMNGSIGMRNESGGVEILLDGHVHTTRSDGKMSPEQVIQWGIANGYNAMIASDHNTITGGLEAKEIAEKKYNDSIIIIPAIEYSTCRIHMNLIGLTENIPIGPAEPSDEDIKHIIDLTHEMGGLVSVNHIPWSNKTGTDLHYPTTPAYAWTLLSTPSFSSESLLKTLHSRPSTSFLFDPAGTRFISYPPQRSIYYAFLPIMKLADYWSSFYDESRGMYSFRGSFCQERKVVLHRESYVTFAVLCICMLLWIEFVMWAVRFAGEKLKKSNFGQLWRRNRRRGSIDEFIEVEIPEKV